MSKPTVAILGASTNRSKYGNKSVRAHLLQGYDVFPVNPKADEIEGQKCYASLEEVPKPVDRVSVYLPPAVGIDLLDAIAACEPNELWLNPGAESEAFIQAAKERGLNVIVACSIVDVGMAPAELDG